MADEQPEDYEIGYGKPPPHTRFKPGQSGNPRGRPKKTTDLQKLFERELGKIVRVTENGQAKTRTVREAFVISVVSAAFKGDRDARRLVLAQMEKSPDLDGLEIDAAAEAMLQDFLNRRSPDKEEEDGQ